MVFVVVIFWAFVLFLLISGAADQDKNDKCWPCIAIWTVLFSFSAYIFIATKNYLNTDQKGSTLVMLSLACFFASSMKFIIILTPFSDRSRIIAIADLIIAYQIISGSNYLPNMISGIFHEKSIVTTIRSAPERDNSNPGLPSHLSGDNQKIIEQDNTPFAISEKNGSYFFKYAPYQVNYIPLKFPEFIPHSELPHIVIEKTLKFGSKYILLISSKSSNAECKTKTYVLTFDAALTKFDGGALIDGCSGDIKIEISGNKIAIFKEQGVLEFYNATIAPEKNAIIMGNPNTSSRPNDKDDLERKNMGQSWQDGSGYMHYSNGEISITPID
jgi:hypothetical protein